VPYELSFRKRLQNDDRESYINDCCIGGDVVVDQMLPAIRERYTDVQTAQEDWGWFIWFRTGGVNLAVDVFTDDDRAGDFRVRLTARIKRLLIMEAVVDTPELDELKGLVTSILTPWAESAIAVQRVAD